jgi:hypothetical protein
MIALWGVTCSGRSARASSEVWMKLRSEISLLVPAQLQTIENVLDFVSPSFSSASAGIENSGFI